VPEVSLQNDQRIADDTPYAEYMISNLSVAYTLLENTILPKKYCKQKDQNKIIQVLRDYFSRIKYPT
jgi:hypothetical protein